MNKFYLCIVISSLLFSCSSEPVVITETDNIEAQLTAEIEDLSTYKGVFTTLDSEHRATFEIRIPNASERSNSVENSGYPEATVNLHSGEVFKVYANEKIFRIEEFEELEFMSSDVSFKLSVLTDDGSPEITNLLYNGQEASALVAEHTSMNPVTTVTGTYSCLDCNGSPYLDTGMTQTFNMMFTVADGEGSIVTQTLLGPTETIGIGYQYFCSPTATTTNCLVISGDGSRTTVGYLANGNPVYWAGIHYFNDQSGENPCDGMFGLWRWESNSYGVLKGIFQSDSNCVGSPDFDDLDALDLSDFGWRFSSQVK